MNELSIRLGKRSLTPLWPPGVGAAFFAAVISATVPFPAKAAFPPSAERSNIAVATNHAYATPAALELLHGGGNAFDGAIAAALTLGVVNPLASGLGEGGFALLYVAKERKIIALDFREAAPAVLDVERMLTKNQPVRGLGIGVPGEPASLEWLSVHYGKESPPGRPTPRLPEHAPKAGSGANDFPIWRGRSDAVLQRRPGLEDRRERPKRRGNARGVGPHRLPRSRARAAHQDDRWTNDRDDAGAFGGRSDAPRSPHDVRAARRARIDPNKVLLAPEFRTQESGTSHLGVADAEGNVVSLTTTVNGPFGARVVAGATGIVLNDELTDFSSAQDIAGFGVIGLGPNRPRPGARPVSSITPTIVLEGGLPILAAGESGGQRIATGVTQATLSRLIFGMDAAVCVSAPRIFVSGASPEILVESEVAEDVRAGLRARGEKVKDELMPFSAMQMVVWDRNSPDANGIRFALIAEGKGPLVLLFHGFPDTAHTWDHVRPLIARKGYRAVSPFMRGYRPTEVRLR